jgi:hypothetical protein
MECPSPIKTSEMLPKMEIQALNPVFWIVFLSNLSILSHGFHTRCHALSIPLRGSGSGSAFFSDHEYRNLGKY